MSADVTNSPEPREQPFPCIDEALRIPGPIGELEALTSCPADGALSATAVVCHPHPLHGGTMQNKVVHYLARTLTELGLRVVRFNFRGVGASEGRYSEGAGEQEDLHAVVQWVRAHQRGGEVWLAGFSFGSYVALREAMAGEVERLITVAPPVESFDFSDLGAPPCPWLLLQGTADEVVSADAVRKWSRRQNPPPEMVFLPGVDHFFHGQLTTLRATLLERLGPAADALRRTPGTWR